jgi:NitT/TauT family transport system substrate-binding protein
MRSRSLLSWLAIFLASLVLTVSCTTSQTPTSQTSPDAASPAPSGEAVQIGYSAWPGWFPWKVTETEKIFEANKVAAKMVWFDSYLDSINALNVGQLDGNSQTLNDTLSAIAGGSDHVIVLTNDNSTGNDQIIVREGINSIADLKGKAIAAEEGTVDHFLLLLGLEREGLTQKDIDFKPLETGAAAAAFAAGKVDAVGVFAPFTTQALKRQGSKALFTSKDFPGAISDHLAVSRKLVETRPQEVQALVNSWFATLDFISKNKDKANQVMAERAGVSLPEYVEYDAGTKIFTLEENLKAFQPGTDMTSLPYAAEEITKFLVESGLAKQKPDLTKLFDDRFVKAYAEGLKKA